MPAPRFDSLRQWRDRFRTTGHSPLGTVPFGSHGIAASIGIVGARSRIQEDEAMHRSATIVVLLVVLALGAGCRSTTGESLGTNLNDTQITSAVKTKLAADQMASLSRVSVTTVRGNVSLTGIVPTAEDRSRAEDIARRVNGVTQVTNNLQTEKK
jgi:osmotically-inducible protein OsmY